MSKVYFYEFSTETQDDLVQKNLKKVFNEAGLQDTIGKHDLSAVKLHIGERGLNTYMSPVWIETIVRKIKAEGAKPYLSDTNVLYKSDRSNAVDHLHLAKDHGFTIENTGAPMIIADGITGNNEEEIEINAPLNESVALATDYLTTDSIIVASHVTGHLATGFGSTIKNIGMGMSSRKGKLVQHSQSKPEINKAQCTTCGKCVEWCPEDAITLYDDYAEIDEAKCIGCGECVAVCRFNAVDFKWDSSAEILQKQIAEHALGIVKQKEDSIGYITFMVNMTEDCDCYGEEAEKIIEDVGVVAGKDPVALDKAVLDLTEERSNESISEAAYPNIDSNVILEYSEEIGLGELDYDIVEI